MSSVLVTGATGQQGGATARALIAAGVPVRALVRDPGAAKAKALESLGAELVTGDLFDRDSLVAAAQGVRAVFSVQMPPMTGDAIDFDGERLQAENLIEAALAAGVPQFVHTAVSGAAQKITNERWASLQPYYTTKSGIQDRVREAGFRHWTLINPGWFMENFLPSAAYLLPRGIEGGLVTVLKPQTRLSLVAVDDIGRAAAAAIAEPERFHGVELELASELLSMTEIAAVLSKAFGTELTAPDLTEEEALAQGMPVWAGVSHERTGAVGQPARPEYARALGIPLTTFEEWSRQYL
ncbi:NmrA/HSCARG family protein [Herbidospora daliensis]|uniref:NmrA/HSCARG family protein n=1 Tax=Herbidospora daliensis TaxID=295585 RepID=UPI0007828ECC|nr:NmrA/HSCARG family protein [Herbidospora daliensis]